MKCRDCGANVASTDKFCGVCGAPQENASPAPSTVTDRTTGESRSIWPGIAIGCGGLIILPLIAVVVLVLLSPELIPSSITFSPSDSNPPTDEVTPTATRAPTATPTRAPTRAPTDTPVPTDTPPPTAAPTAEPTATTAPVAELPVSFLQGDARWFDDPPMMIAYANANYSPPPSAVTITDSGGLWRHNEWIALMDGDQWIEVTHSGTAVDSVGIQFWGDTNDGWVRVLVDGAEKWRGSIYGSDDDPFIRYLKMTNLGAGPHTIRVEALGDPGLGGGNDVAIFFFGFE